nr:immunoglobulin heavy chain junction region [Mus musculus]
PPAQPTWSSA